MNTHENRATPAGHGSLPRSSFFEASDQRPQRFGWGPGTYQSECCHCHRRFVGDKRAVLCAPCAYNDEGMDSLRKLAADRERLDWLEANRSWHLVESEMQRLWRVKEDNCYAMNPSLRAAIDAARKPEAGT